MPSPPPADAASYQQLVAAQGQSRRQLTDLAVGLATTAATGFAAWYDDAAVAAWALRIATTIQAIQRQAAALTDAYLARLASLMTGRPVAPVGTIAVADLRKGVTGQQVYERVAETYRYAVSTGADPQKALQDATQRADVIADTDVTLATRDQSQKFMIVRRVDGFRRVIHPELSKSGTCGLCVAASQRFYHRDELMALHARCECTVAPIINSIDPGHILNQSDLATLYKQAGGTSAAKLTSVRYSVHDNGELGPVLAAHGQHFRGPHDLPLAS